MYTSTDNASEQADGAFMKGNNSEKGSSSKESKADKLEHRQKCAGLKIPSQKRKLNFNISRRELESQSEKASGEETDEYEMIEASFALQKIRGRSDRK